MNSIANAVLVDFGNTSAREEVCPIVPYGHDCGENVNVQECLGQKPFPCATPDEDGAINPDEVNICQEFSQCLSLDSKVPKQLNKCKTFPLSKEIQTNPSSTCCKPNSPAAILVQNQASLGSGTFAYTRSISFPPSSTLISAMKGGRALNGKVAKSEIRVKWAPEVYDPPATTVSHTVKSHQQRPKSKKDKHKKWKGKSSRGNGGEKKRGNPKGFNKIPEAPSIRSQESGENQVVDVFGKCNVVDFPQYAINDPKVKCGSSFLREGLPKLHLPFGEAS